jgi:hypothetical protein
MFNDIKTLNRIFGMKLYFRDLEEYQALEICYLPGYLNLSFFQFAGLFVM